MVPRIYEEWERMPVPKARSTQRLFMEELDFVEYSNGKTFADIYFSSCRFELLVPRVCSYDLYYGGAWLGSCLRRSFFEDVGVQWSHLVQFFQDPEHFEKSGLFSQSVATSICLSMRLLWVNTDPCWYTEKSADVSQLFKEWESRATSDLSLPDTR